MAKSDKKVAALSGSRAEIAKHVNGRNLSQISSKLGRNSSYLQQHLRYATPKVLPEKERRALARLLNLDEKVLREVERHPDSSSTAKVPSSVSRTPGMAPKSAESARLKEISPVAAKQNQQILGIKPQPTQSGAMKKTDAGGVSSVAHTSLAVGSTGRPGIASKEQRQLGGVSNTASPSAQVIADLAVWSTQGGDGQSSRDWCETGEYHRKIHRGGDFWSLPTHYVEKALHARYDDLLILDQTDQRFVTPICIGEVIIVDRSKRDLSREGMFLVRDDNGYSLQRMRTLIGSRPHEIEVAADSKSFMPQRLRADSLIIIGRVVARISLE